MSDYDLADIARLHDQCSVRKTIPTDADDSLEALFLRTDATRLAVLDAIKAFRKAHEAFLSTRKTLKDMPADETPRLRRATEVDAKGAEETLVAAAGEVNQRATEWGHLDNVADEEAKLHEARIAECAAAVQAKAFAAAAVKPGVSLVVAKALPSKDGNVIDLTSDTDEDNSNSNYDRQSQVKEQSEDVSCIPCSKSGTTCGGRPAGSKKCKPCRRAKDTCRFPGEPDTPPPDTNARSSSPKKTQTPKPKTPAKKASARAEKDKEKKPKGHVELVQLMQISESLNYLRVSFSAGSPGNKQHNAVPPGVFTAHVEQIMQSTSQSAATLQDMEADVRESRRAVERIATVAEAFAMAITGAPPQKRKAGDLDGPKTPIKRRRV